MAESTNGIPVTKESYDYIKRLYKRAVDAGQDQFESKWGPLVTNYAKYLLEYLEMRLGIKN